jgi:hypothetical protein
LKIQGACNAERNLSRLVPPNGTLKHIVGNEKVFCCRIL